MPKPYSMPPRPSAWGVSLLEANFFGMGPKLGVSGDVGLGSGLRISALTAGSLLFGRSEVISLSNCGCDNNLEDYRQNREARAVPVFDGRLGLGYDYAPRGRQGFGLGFEGGVLGQQWMNLQDFVNQGSGQFLGIATPTIADTTDLLRPLSQHEDVVVSRAGQG